MRAVCANRLSPQILPIKKRWLAQGPGLLTYPTACMTVYDKAEPPHV